LLNWTKIGKFKEVEWDKWFYSTGAPPVAPKFDESLAIPCETLCKRWVNAKSDYLNQFSNNDLKHFAADQIVEFLARLLEEQTPLSVVKIEKMEVVYNFNQLKNFDAKANWQRLCIKAKWEKIIDAAIKFALVDQGRMKYSRALFRDLYNWDKARDQLVKTFKERRPFMHSTTAGIIEREFKL